MNKVIQKLKQDGFDVNDNNKILAATPVRVRRFVALGYNFMTTQDEKGNIKQSHYRPVKKSDASKLKGCIDPVTGNPYLKFAYVPLPESYLTDNVNKNQIEEVDTVEKREERAGVETVNLDKMEVKVNEKPAPEVKVDPKPPVQPVTPPPEKPLPNPELDDESNFEDSEDGEEEDEDKGLSAAEIERAEYAEMNEDDLKKIIIEDLGYELAGSESKEELIDMILN